MNKEKLFSRYECCIPLSILSSQLNTKSQIPKVTEVLMENLILKSESIHKQLQMHQFKSFNELWKEFSFQILNIINTEYFIQVTYLIIQSNPIHQKLYFLVNIHYQSQYLTNIFAEAVIINEKEQSPSQVPCKLQNSIIVYSNIDVIEKILRNYKLFHQVCPSSCDALQTTSDYLKEGDTFKVIFHKKRKFEFELKVTKYKKSNNYFAVHYVVLNYDYKGKITTPFQRIEFICKLIGPSKLEINYDHYFKERLEESFLEQFNKEKNVILEDIKKYAEKHNK